MSQTNYFKVYAGASSGSNTYTDSQWASACPTVGPVSGDTVQSKPLNTALRQATLVTAALCDYVTGNSSATTVGDVGLSTTQSNLAGYIHKAIVNSVSSYGSDHFAPISHAFSTADYGAATNTLYGHVKLITGDLSTGSYEDGFAASQSHTHSQYFNNKSTPSTDTSTNLFLEGISASAANQFEINLTIDLCEGNGTSSAATTVNVSDKIVIPANSSAGDIYVMPLHFKSVLTQGSTTYHNHAFYMSLTIGSTGINGNVVCYHASSTSAMPLPQQYLNAQTYGVGKAVIKKWWYRKVA